MKTLWGYGWKLWTPSSISSSKAVLLTEMEKFRFLSWHWTPCLPGEPALLKRGDISNAKKCGHMCCLLHFMIHTITFHTFLMFTSWPFIILKMKGRVREVFQKTTWEFLLEFSMKGGVVSSSITIRVFSIFFAFKQKNQSRFTPWLPKRV